MAFFIRVRPGQPPGSPNELKYTLLSVVAFFGVVGPEIFLGAPPWLIGGTMVAFVVVGAVVMLALNQASHAEIAADDDAPPLKTSRPLVITGAARGVTTSTEPSAPAQLVAPVVAAPHACPRCGRTLAGEQHGERTCAFGCGSLLLAGQAEHLIVHRAQLQLELARGLAREQGAERSACPTCAARMRETRLLGVAVDLCLACGSLWIDRGERSRLTRDDAFRS